MARKCSVKLFAFCVVVPFLRKLFLERAGKFIFSRRQRSDIFRGWCVLTAKFKVEKHKTESSCWKFFRYRKLVQRNALNLFLRDTNRSVIDLNSRSSIQKCFYRNANREKSIKDCNWNQYEFLSLMPRLVYHIPLNKC